jgi:hypothetical protein
MEEEHHILWNQGLLPPAAQTSRNPRTHRAMSQMAFHKTPRNQHRQGRVQQSDLIHLLRRAEPVAGAETPLTKEAQEHLEEITQNVLKVSHRKRLSTDNYVLVTPLHESNSHNRDPSIG